MTLRATAMFEPASSGHLTVLKAPTFWPVRSTTPGRRYKTASAPKTKSRRRLLLQHRASAGQSSLVQPRSLECICCAKRPFEPDPERTPSIIHYEKTGFGTEAHRVTLGLRIGDSPPPASAMLHCRRPERCKTKHVFSTKTSADSDFTRTCSQKVRDPTSRAVICTSRVSGLGR